MSEEINTDSNCIIKAFENHPISILSNHINDKKVYYFKASDIGKALNLTNIAVSIQNYDDDERVLREAYDTTDRLQNTTFLTSQGVYRLLYNSKKPIAKKFRKWAGDILDDIIFNESAELKKRLREKEEQLEEQKKLVKQLENKPEVGTFDRDAGYVYLIRDIDKQGHYKIGFASDPEKRLIDLNVGSSTKSLEIVLRFQTADKDFAERCIHLALKPFKIKNRKEWFYIADESDLHYVIDTMKKITTFINGIIVKDQEELKNAKKGIDTNSILELLSQESEIDSNSKKTQSEINSRIVHQMGPKTGNYKGAFFVKEKQLWRGELKKNYKSNFLGYYQSELEAAKAYNDYALWLNREYDDDYSLNDIVDYVPVPRNVPVEYTQEHQESKTSVWHGVSYDSNRKHYVAGIKFNKKSYNLGARKSDVECAKLFNQQALYYNIHHQAQYILNDIPGYTTIEKDIIYENQSRKLLGKSSKYTGVTFDKQKNKWRACLVYNRKQLHVGFFDDELSAAKAYNIKATELNTTSNGNYKINII